jgi:hypothetical protein
MTPEARHVAGNLVVEAMRIGLSMEDLRLPGFPACAYHADEARAAS